jgi:hypothetical protein
MSTHEGILINTVPRLADELLEHFRRRKESGEGASVTLQPPEEFERLEGWTHKVLVGHEPKRDETLHDLYTWMDAMRIRHM